MGDAGNSDHVSVQVSPCYVGQDSGALLVSKGTPGKRRHFSGAKFRRWSPIWSWTILLAIARKPRSWGRYPDLPFKRELSM